MAGAQETIPFTAELNAQPHLWVDAYADYLYSYAMCRIKDEELARDLVQETFLAALEKADKFGGRSSEKTWLTAILKYKIIDVYRSRSRSFSDDPIRDCTSKGKTFFQEDGHWNLEDRPHPFGIEEANKLENKELQKALLHCLQKLPALWMTIFTMKFMEDVLAHSICEQLNLSSANYWVIIHRTKINLRACLQKNWP
ncbi:MAG: sigma-70 family RNA polymerase sigma factor [Chitinophagaceae bacterium]